MNLADSSPFDAKFEISVGLIYICVFLEFCVSSSLWFSIDFCSILWKLSWLLIDSSSYGLLLYLVFTEVNYVILMNFWEYGSSLNILFGVAIGLNDGSTFWLLSVWILLSLDLEWPNSSSIEFVEDGITIMCYFYDLAWF